MEKFTRLREGDFWVLDTVTDIGALSEGLLITKGESDELDFVTLYLWGVDDDKNPYKTPKDFLLSLVKRTFKPANAHELVEDKFISPAVQCMGTYIVGVNQGAIKEQNVVGMTEGEAVINGLNFLPNPVLAEIINQETTDCIVPVYCLNGNPDQLTTNQNYPDAQQIGYALVDTVAMEANSFFSDATKAVNSYLNQYGYEYYIWDGLEQTWEFEDSGDGYYGDNPRTNGLFRDFEMQGIDWEDAVLDEWFADDEEDDWIEDDDNEDEEKEEWYEDYDDNNGEVFIEEVV